MWYRAAKSWVCSAGKYLYFLNSLFNYFEVNCTFQDFDKAMSRGLRRARAMQGGGDREGAIMVVESEVGQVDL